MIINEIVRFASSQPTTVTAIKEYKLESSSFSDANHNRHRRHSHNQYDHTKPYQHRNYENYKINECAKHDNIRCRRSSMLVDVDLSK